MDLAGKSRTDLEHDLRALHQAHEFYKRAHPTQRRATDGPHEDHAGERATSNGNGGFDIGFKGWGVHARGPLGILAVVFVLMTGVMGWINYRGFEDLKRLQAEANKGHVDLANAQDRMTCIISLSPEEKTRLRIQGSREAFYTFCNWLRLP